MNNPNENLPEVQNDGQGSSMVSAKSQVKPLQLSNFETLWRFAGCLATSGMLPKSYGHGSSDELRAKAVIALQMGAEVGLQPMQAIQNIAVVNGMPTIWGDAQLALVKQSGLCEWHKEEVTGQGDNMKAVVTTKRKGDDPVIGEFSMADAARAGLKGKSGPWQQYPQRMIKYRARAFALRDAYPDVLKGLTHTYEEMIDVTPTASENQAERKRADTVGASIASLAQQEAPQIAAHDAEADKNSAASETMTDTGKNADRAASENAPLTQRRHMEVEVGTISDDAVNPLFDGDGEVEVKENADS